MSAKPSDPPNRLEEQLDNLPSSPGVYLMKTAQGTLVYVGKAKNLRSRVRSYFTAGRSDHRYFARHIEEIVRDIEIIVTGSEKEALLLENTLIKEHAPRFNVQLKDDKNFLSLRFDLKEEWPRIEIIRRPKKDDAQYFGPYHSARAARETLRLVQRSFKLRSCSNRYMAGRTRPCLQHQMKRCLAPCVLDVDRSEYRREVEHARLFLLGRRDELTRSLHKRMLLASETMDYEKAARFRDQLGAVELTLSPQNVLLSRSTNQDVLGIARRGDEVQIAILVIREGKLHKRLDYPLSSLELPSSEIVSSFIAQRYTTDQSIPGEIVVPLALPDARVIVEVLSERRGRPVRITHPRKGRKLEQIELAERNAHQLLESRLSQTDAMNQQLSSIQKRLKLPRLPRHIECVDISHLGGDDTVGAISVIIDGVVQRARRRNYRVRSVSGGDDYGAMREVLTRRFTRAKRADRGWAPPDLLVVDGGRGQLSIARAVLRELDLREQPVVALAKEREGHDGAETDRAYLPGRKNPIPLKARTSALHILALARDEAHRQAIGHQRRRRRKSTLESTLDGVPGIGPKLRGTLLKRFGSVKRLREASPEELAETPGVGPILAHKLHDSLATPVKND
jgi:excinuclease ABC subunit C